ncbi:MAG: DNA polymerase III subunit gamma/tau, partial [Anaerolineales bacterium]
MSQTLYLKWRPSNWNEIIGQPHIVQTLKNTIAGERQAHAYLFSGPRGTGKTSAARILAKAVNCLTEEPGDRPCDQCDHCKALTAGRFLDLIEIDAASNTSVEDVRDLREKINFSPNQGRYKVYIIDEVHMLSTAAFNALLKTLEEPPTHAIFILATTEVHKIPATVLSRCQRYDFRRIPLPDLVQHLKNIVDQEKFEIDPIALTLIARQATGSMRDAISLLDQLASSGEKITLAIAETMLGTATCQAVIEIVENLATGQISAGLDRIQIALDAGSEPRLFARQVVDYLRNVMLVKMGSLQQVDATEELKTQIARHAQLLSMPLVLKTIRAFNQAALDGRLAWQAALPLEMAFLDSLDAGQLPSDDSPINGIPTENQHLSQIPEPAKAVEDVKADEYAQGEPSNTTEASDLTVKENLEIVKRLRFISDSKAVKTVMEKLQIDRYQNRKVKFFSIRRYSRIT